MTGLDKRAVKRETRVLDPIRRRRPLIVKLEIGGRVLRIKVKGDRRWYTVNFEDIYRLGCHIRAQEIKAEKAARRKARAS